MFLLLMSCVGLPPAQSAPGGTVSVVVSIHVEGFKDIADSAEVYQRQATIIRTAAREAKDAHIPLSLELTVGFAQAAAQWDPGFAQEMIALGHGVALHADLGGRPIADADYTRVLKERVAAVAKLGVAPHYASGVCSTGGWVEGMVDAGLKAAVGLVGWCLKSMPADSLPRGADVGAIQACRTPADCHEPAISDLSMALHPWRASSAASWTTPDPSGKLLIIGSAESLGTVVANPKGRGRQWVFGDTEAAALKSRIGAALTAADPARPNVLAYTISVGARPEKGFFGEVAAASAGHGARVQWQTIDSVIELLDR